MDFTREPIIESVITPKEGCKLVVRSSKGAGQEEFFVDSLEVVSFGNTFFLRSRERPKSFLVPASDYEVLEVRETRMVLKNVGLDKSIKIGGGREPAKRGGKDSSKSEPAKEQAPASDAKTEPKRKERRRSQRRRRGRDEVVGTEKSAGDESTASQEADHDAAADRHSDAQSSEAKQVSMPPQEQRALLAPPPTLISETIQRYKGDETFKHVFFSPGEEEKVFAASAESSGEVNLIEGADAVAPVEVPVDEPSSAEEAPTTEVEQETPAVEEVELAPAEAPAVEEDPKET